MGFKNRINAYLSIETPFHAGPPPMAHVPNPIRESLYPLCLKVSFSFAFIILRILQQLFDQLSVFYTGGSADA